MKRRIFWSVLLTSLAGLLLFGVFAVGIVYYQNLQTSWKNLSHKASYLSASLKNNDIHYLADVHDYSSRVTLIDTDGTVLFDDWENPANMDNHANRPEIQDALTNGSGKSTRTSSTLGQQTLYYAVRLKNGKILRVAETSASILGQTTRLIPWFMLVVLFLGVVSASVARRQTKAIIQPINQLNLDQPFEADAYGELSPLLRRIGEQKSVIRTQMHNLQEKQQEFELITRNMEEGLILVNQSGMVLSINNSAKKILDVQGGNPEGMHILTLNRNIALDKAIQHSIQGQRVNEILEFHGKKYQLTTSPSWENNTAKGAVILLLDVTSRMLAEQQRREFSANVSHELKTPLTSISGYAELIQRGLAKPEDIQGFAGLIRDEATRLMALVEDIIKLSRLDEKSGEPQMVLVNLMELAKQVILDLTQKATAKGLAIELEGQTVTVMGVPSILSEVIYNLVDNAIRYSEKGAITLTITQDESNAILCVKDNGIGIPDDEKERIFERFYRVDKSHSKQSGGTGLGLAIVKRGVLYHNGSVSVQSTLGKGSVFSVHLPLE